LLQYVDDWLFAASKENAARACRFTIVILRLLGWVVNKKGQAVPGPDIAFLGVGIDADSHVFFATREKVLRAISLLDEAESQLQARGGFDYKHLERLTGFVQSQALAIPAVKVWTRQLYSDMAVAHAAGSKFVPANDRNVEEIRMLRFLFENHNGAPIGLETAATTYFLDAGETGIGAHSTDESLEHFSEVLPDALIGTSSTQRELYTLKALLWRHGNVLAKPPCFTFDSADTVCTLTRGSSPVQAMQDLVKDIFLLLTKLELRPVYAWVRREQNVLADKLSKRWCQAWRLTEPVLKSINATWPEVTVRLDRFNKLGNILRSRSPGAGPPLVVIAPRWPSQSWWPLLLKLSKDARSMGRAMNVFRPSWRLDPIGVGEPPWEILAVLI
jgi:hypothetical protein